MSVVVVVGGGVIGLATALELADRGCSVTLFDAGHVGSGATQAAGGMLAPISEADVEHPDLIALGQESLGRYREWATALETRTGIPCEYRDDGALWVAVRRDDMVELERLAQTLALKGLAVEVLDPAAVLEREPRLTGRLVGGLSIPADHQVNPRALSLALVAALEDAGVSIHENTAVDGLQPDGAAWRVSAGDSAVIAEQVVVATGAAAGPTLHPALAPLAQRPVKGQVLLLREPSGEALIRHFVRTPEVYLVPRADGQLFVGATVEEMGYDTRPTAGAAMDLLRAAWEALPGIYELEVLEVAVGLRPAAPDHMPLIGPLEEAPGLFASVGHYRNGILLAPASAAHLATALLDGEVPAALVPFLPRRITARDASERHHRNDGRDA